MGFEPTASTLTGWRALQAAPRGQCLCFVVAQVGLEPTASLVLSQGRCLPSQPPSALLPIARRPQLLVPRAGIEPANTQAHKLELGRASQPVGLSGHLVKVVLGGLDPAE